MTWDSWERAANKGPEALMRKVGCLTIIVIVLVAPVAYLFGWFGEAAQVAREEFGPRELLRKYEWFKDASAALDAKLANLKQYEMRLKNLESAYGDDPRSKWSRDDRQQHSIWQSEMAGLAASFNELAADYNAQMAKFNWRFTNAGDLPQGATVPLPREFKPYLYGGVQ